MNCEYCFHKCTLVDFATLRNLCEHLYLDALAKKRNSFLASTTLPPYIPIYNRERLRSLLPSTMELPSAREELLALEK